MFLNKTYWNKRYLENDFGWDTGEITSPLKSYFDQLNTKELKILVPGAGNAYEAEYLHKGGFKNVFVLDFAEQALQNLLKRCSDFPKNHLIQSDFFDHESKYDLIIEQTFFCALQPNLRPKYALHCNRLLNTGGKLTGLLFNDVLNADKPPFGGNKDEYLTYFEPYFNVNTFELCYNSIKPREGRELFINLTKK